MRFKTKELITNEMNTGVNSKKAEEKLQAILQTAIDGFWICSLNGKFLEVNDAYCTMTGYTREELLKMSIMDIEAIEKPGETAQRIKKIIEQGSDRFETRHRCKDGHIIDIEISVKYHNIDQGQLTVFVRDITERKKEQKALRESEEKFSKAFHMSPVIVAITTIKDGRFIDINHSYTIRTGYTKEEILGKTTAEMHIWAHPEDRVKMFKILQERRRVQDLEIDFRMKSGEIRTWLFSAESIDISGEPCLISVCFDITERKLMEKSLANEAIRRRILVEQSRDGIVVLDENGAVYEANRRFADMLGYSLEEIRSLHVWDWEFLYPPEKVREMIRTVDEAGDHFETQHKRKDGSIYDVEISTNGAMFAGQKLIFCVCRDITERKKAEKEIQESEAKYRSIFENSKDAILLTSPEGGIIAANPAATGMFGRSEEEICRIGRNGVVDITDPKLAQKLKNRERTGEFVGELTLIRADGTKFPGDVSTKIFYDKDGKARTSMIIRDIIERKKAETALRQHKELIERILSTTPSAVAVIDKYLKIKLANRAFCDIFKKSLDDLFGKSISEIIPSEELLKEVSKVALHNEPHINKEFNFMCNDQESLFVANILQMQEGEVLLILNDVTEERERQEKLYLTDRLASIGEMAAGIAHEINNPLTGVLGLSQLLLKEEMPDDAKEDLNSIYGEARRAANVVKNLLTFARKHESTRQPTQINKVLDDVLKLRSYEQKVHNIIVDLHIDRDLPEITVDPFQLQQVFLNLVLNAEQAMIEEHGEGTLTISTERVNDDIKISFSDNGPGISPDNMRKLFSPFFTTKEVGKGTGLGLSVCYGIISDHGGKISAQSKLSEGSTFIVELPINNRQEV